MFILKLIYSTELNVIVEALKRWDLDPALKWALNHKGERRKSFKISNTKINCFFLQNN